MAQTFTAEQRDCYSENRTATNSVNDKVRQETSPSGRTEPASRDDTLHVSASDLRFQTIEQDLASYLGIARDSMNQRCGRTEQQQIMIDQMLRPDREIRDNINDVSQSDPQMDRRMFHNNFVHDIREAYAREGNNPRFWNTLGKLMSQDLQQMVDDGQMSAADKSAFDKSFMNAVRDVYKTDGKGSPNEFWKKLEDRLVTDIQKSHDLPTPPKPDDGGDNPQPNPNPTPTDGSVKEARERLHQSMAGTMDGDRLGRFDKMCAEFEKHGSERVEQQVAAGKDRATAEKEWNDMMKRTYDSLNEMVSTNPSGAVYDQATRAKMAENAMFLFMDPSRENQGAHGTCWIESTINLIGMNNHPDEMARLLKEVTLTGGYTDHDGKHYNIPRDLLQFPGEEKDWTISNAGNGTRSPVGAIFDRTISFLEGRRDGGTNGGTPNEAVDLMRKVTGDDSVKMINIRDNNLTDSDISRILSPENKQAMLMQGGVILIGPGHMFAATMSKENGQWSIHGDNQWGDRNDQLIGVVNDIGSWNVTQTRQQYKPDDPDMRLPGDSALGYRSAPQQQDQGVVSRVMRFVFGSSQPAAYDDTNPYIRVGGPSSDVQEVQHPQKYIVISGERHKIHRQFDESKYRHHIEVMNETRRRLAVYGEQ